MAFPGLSQVYFWEENPGLSRVLFLVPSISALLVDVIMNDVVYFSGLTSGVSSTEPSSAEFNVISRQGGALEVADRTML